MSCRSCGSEIPDDASACPSCRTLFPAVRVDAFEADADAAPVEPAGPAKDRRAEAPTVRRAASQAATVVWEGTPEVEESRFLPGTVLAERYRIVHLLGKGAMGEVYRADDLKLGLPGGAEVPAGGDGDRRGPAGAVSGRGQGRPPVSHPNVCRVYDVGEVDGHDASFSPAGDRVVTVSRRKVRVWQLDELEAGLRDGNTPAEPIVLEGPQHSFRGDAAWSPAGDRIAVASDDGSAWIWAADGRGDPIVLKGHEGSLQSVSWSPSGDRLVTASNDRTARVWTIEQRDGESPDDRAREPIVLEDNREPLRIAMFDPSGDRVVTVSWPISWAGTVRVWSLTASDLVAAVKAATKVCLDPDFRERTLGEEPEVASESYAECERSHGRRGPQPASAGFP